MLNFNKAIRVSKEYLRSIFMHRLIFMHIAPTRKCNLRCKYCYQFGDTMEEMSLDVFKKNINNNYKLGLSIVAFTGGEPLLWKYLDGAIEYCAEKNIFTQLTTNGTLLTSERLDRLRKLGLDYLMISIDSVTKKPYSQKTISDNPSIINLLKYARYKGMVISWNTVLTRYNYEDVYDLIEMSGKERIPISIGIIISPPNKKDDWDGDGLEFTDFRDNGLLKKIVDRLKYYKNNRYPIIEPQKYFEDMEKYLNGKCVWDCSLAKKRTVQVSPKSEIYWCSKLNLVSPYKANSFNGVQMNKFKRELSNIIKKCNQNCYSNCAYNGYYLQKHKFYFLTNTLPMYLSSLFTTEYINSAQEVKINNSQKDEISYN